MKRALLVNDSKFENLIMQDMLNKLEYEVEIASEFDALIELERFVPDLVIVNFIMQETRGDQLIELLKAQDPEVVCLLSSSSSIRKSDFDKHVDGILRTPVSLFTLQDTLGRVGMLDHIDVILGRQQDNELKDEDIKKSKEKRSSNIDTMFCPGCDKDLSQFGSMIIFCPYCGEDLS